MKIVLINPPAKEIVEHGDAPGFPHIGLAYLGEALSSKGINPMIIDARFEGISFDVVLERVRKIEPDIVGITAMTHMIHDADELSGHIKRMFPTAYVLIGGPHASALPVQTLSEFLNFDISVKGEGEITLCQLIEELKGRNKLERVDGIAFRFKNKIVINRPRHSILDIDTLPYPAWHLFPKSENYDIMTQRGCPGRCKFCQSGRSRMRIRSPENIVKEMDLLVNEYGAKHIGTIDNFGASKMHLNQILHLLRGRYSDVKIIASVRVNMIDDDIVRKMKEAGVIHLCFGVESGDEEILKKSNKGITIEQALKTSGLAKKFGLKDFAYFILGHPNETRETARKTINLIAKMNPFAVSIGLMVPYPGTEIFEMAQKGQGGYKLLSTDWRVYNKQYGNALELEKLSRIKMEKFQSIGYLKLYLYNFRFLDLIKVIFKNRKLIIRMLKKLFIYPFAVLKLKKIKILKPH